MRGGQLKQTFIFLVLLFVVSLNCYAEETRAVSILLDVSRSLKPADFEKTKATVQQWLDQDHWNLGSLYTFGSKMEKITREQLTSTTATESYTSFNDAAYDAMQDLTKQSADKKALIDFKETRTLGDFITERGKIIPSRVTGTCTWHQRKLAAAIKQARSIALLPYAAVRI